MALTEAAGRRCEEGSSSLVSCGPGSVSYGRRIVSEGAGHPCTCGVHLIHSFVRSNKRGVRVGIEAIRFFE
jgi:hypothetical protein